MRGLKARFYQGLGISESVFYCMEDSNHKF